MSQLTAAVHLDFQNENPSDGLKKKKNYTHTHIAKCQGCVQIKDIYMACFSKNGEIVMKKIRFQHVISVTLVWPNSIFPYQV